MADNEKSPYSEQDLSNGELVDQEPLEEIQDPPVSSAGYNQIPDFGDDVKGTLRESSQQSGGE